MDFPSSPRNSMAYPATFEATVRKLAFIRQGWRPEVAFWCARAAALFGLLSASLILSAFLGPRLVAEWAKLIGKPVGYEGGMRLCLALTMAVSLLAARALGWRRWNLSQRRLWATLAATSGVLMLIFAFDWGSLLQDEYSWIRYPTAAALCGAGLGCMLIAWRNRQPRTRLTVMWMVLALGFHFAWLDEIFQLHEAFGQLLKGVRYPSLATDLVTVGYFAACLLVVAVLWRVLQRSGQGGQTRSHLVAQDSSLARLTRGYLSAAILFGIAQLLDTVDKQIQILLQYIVGRELGAGQNLPGFWYLLSSPRQLCNSVEEILECVAAVLFLFFTWSLLLEMARKLPKRLAGTEGCRQ